jgi:hypothetical protein
VSAVRLWSWFKNSQRMPHARTQRMRTRTLADAMARVIEACADRARGVDDALRGRPFQREQSIAYVDGYARTHSEKQKPRP